MSERFFTSNILKTALFALCLAFILWAGSMCAAALASFRALSYLEAWRSQQDANPAYQVPDIEYQKALGASMLARKLVPYNSDYHVTVADILLWQISHTANMPKATRDRLRTDIINYYQAAIQRQPFWPYHYVHYARTKAELGEIDSEMMQALKTAHQFGPYEVYTLHTIIDLGLRNWPKLDEPTRLLTADAVDRSLTWDVRDELRMNEQVFALSMIGLLQRQADICPLLKTQSPQVTTMCQPTIKPGSAKGHK